MCLKQELKLRSKNTNPKNKNLKITIFSNPEISSNPKNPAKSISFKRKPANPYHFLKPSKIHLIKNKPSKPISFSQTQQTQQNPSHLKANPANPANPSWSNLVADKYYCVFDLKTEEEKNSRFADSRIKIPI